MATQGSEASYLRRRDARIEELFLREGEEPRDIAVKMLAESSIESVSEESATRIVRGVVAKIRKRIDAARGLDSEAPIATSEIDAIERKLTRLRGDRAWHLMVAAGEPNVDGVEALTITSTDTPQGPITSSRPKWPAGKRVDARKEAARLAEKIAELEILLVDRRDAQSEIGHRSEGGGLIVIESDKSIPDLIRANLLVGTFGKKGNDGGSGAAANA